MYNNIIKGNFTDKRLANMILHSSYNLNGIGDLLICNNPKYGLTTTLL